MVYFGTIDGPLAEMQEIPCMVSPLATSHDKYVASTKFENGGTHLVKSSDSHKRYELTFNGHNNKADIDVVMDYYHGEYGQGLLYMTDPALLGSGKNVLRRNWATPALIPTGYKNIVDAEYTEGAGVLPTLTWELTGANTRRFVIPVPTGHTLWLGARYSATGTAEISVYKDGALVGAITPSAIDGNALFTDSYAGEGIFHIEISGDEGDFITVQTMDAQIHPNGYTPPATGKHIRGQGVSGMKFSTDSVPYEYVQQSTGFRSFSVELVEVEEWQ